MALAMIGEPSLSSGRRLHFLEPDPSGYPELRWATWRRFDPGSSPSATQLQTKPS